MQRTSMIVIVVVLILGALGCTGNSQKGMNKDLDRPGTPTTKPS